MKIYLLYLYILIFKIYKYIMHSHNIKKYDFKENFN